MHVGVRSFGRAAPGATLAVAVDSSGDGAAGRSEGALGADGTTLALLERGSLGLVTEVQRLLATSAIDSVPLREVKPLPSTAIARQPPKPTLARVPVLGRASELQQARAAAGGRAAEPQLSARREHAERATALAELLESPGPALDGVPPADPEASWVASAVAQPLLSIPLSECLLYLASSGTNAALCDLYDQMSSLASAASKAARERLQQQLPNSNLEVKAPEVDACFHVAIDLPGYGLSEKDPERPWANTEPADVLADIMRSLGKTHAYALVGSEQSAAFILKALAERPAFARFAILQEPTTSCDNTKMLMHILQHVRHMHIHMHVHVHMYMHMHMHAQTPRC